MEELDTTRGGQRVRIKRDLSGGCPVGEKGTTFMRNSRLALRMDSGYESRYIRNPHHYLEVIATSTYPNPPHKHAEVIKAWADGAAIQFRGDGVKWSDTPAPLWSNAYEYRIKPQPSPQEIEKQSIIEEMAKLQERLDKLKVS